MENLIKIGKNILLNIQGICGQGIKRHYLTILVSPVPELFRDVARQKIAGKIGELALKEDAKEITEDLVIRGYIIATPKRDHKFLKKKLLNGKLIWDSMSIYSNHN